MGITGGTTVYDYAVVLVGNVHQETALTNGNTPYTIMSADLDFDNEPDYSFIFSHSGRQVIYCNGPETQRSISVAQR